MATPIVCVDGEVEVAEMIVAINELLASCELMTACCEKYSVGDVIRIHKVGNEMWMTNDGSDPTP